MKHRVEVIECPECGFWRPVNAPTCIVCGASDEDDELFDADELGLDPEDDDERKYPCPD